MLATEGTKAGTTTVWLSANVVVLGGEITVAQIFGRDRMRTGGRATRYQKVAWPFSSSEPEPMLTALSKKSTLPVGISPPPSFPVTVAVKVTSSPRLAGVFVGCRGDGCGSENNLQVLRLKCWLRKWNRRCIGP